MSITGAKARNVPLSRAEENEIMDRFYRDGFALVPDVFDDEECAELRRVTDRHMDRLEAEGRGTGILREPERLDVAFLRPFTREPMFSLVQRILGPECRFCAQNVIRTRTGQAISHWHVDDKLEYPLPAEIPRWDERVRLPIMWISVQVPLSDITTPDNGPTEIVRGSQFSGRLPADKDPTFEGRGPEPVLCRAGDIYLFNHQVWHRGRPNLSTTTRYLMQLQYARGDSIAFRLQGAERTKELERVLQEADPQVTEFMLRPTLYSSPGHFNRMG